MDIDSRAILAYILVFLLVGIVLFAIYQNWDQERMISTAGIFTPFVTAVVGFYFGNKNSDKLIENDKTRAETEKTVAETKKIELEIQKKNLGSP